MATITLNYNANQIYIRYNIPYSEFNNNKTASNSDTYTLIEKSGLYYKKIDGSICKFKKNIDINPTKQSTYLYKYKSFYKSDIFDNDDIDSVIEIYMYLEVYNEYTEEKVTYTSNSIMINIPDSKYKFNDTPLNTLAATINYNMLYDNDIGLNDNDKINIKNIIDNLSFNMNECGYNEYPDIRYIKKTNNFAGGLWGNDPIINDDINNIYLDKNGKPIDFTSKKSTIFNGLTLNGKNTFLNIDRDSNNTYGLIINYNDETDSITFKKLNGTGDTTVECDIIIKNNIILELCGNGGDGAKGIRADSYQNYNDRILDGGGGGGGGAYIALLIDITKAKNIDIRRYSAGYVIITINNDNSKYIKIYDGELGYIEYDDSTDNGGTGNGGTIEKNRSDKEYNEYGVYTICSQNGAGGGLGDFSTESNPWFAQNGSKVNSYYSSYNNDIKIEKETKNGGKTLYKEDVIYEHYGFSVPINSNPDDDVFLGYGGGGGASAISNGGDGRGYIYNSYSYTNPYTNNGDGNAPSYGGGGGGGSGSLKEIYNDNDQSKPIPLDDISTGGKGGSWLIRVYAESLDGTPAKWKG